VVILLNPGGTGNTPPVSPSQGNKEELVISDLAYPGGSVEVVVEQQV
jgi:hypothetical protein